MTPYDLIKTQLGENVPFARHAGVRLTAVADGAAEAALDETATSVNHIGSQHAAALFALGETASGAAMAGLFADRLLNIRPVTTNATIAFQKIAKGTITARAKTVGAPDALRAALDRDGRTRLDVEIVLSNAAGVEVATMTVEWDVKKL